MFLITHFVLCPQFLSGNVLRRKCFSGSVQLNWNALQWYVGSQEWNITKMGNNTCSFPTVKCSYVIFVSEKPQIARTVRRWEDINRECEGISPSLWCVCLHWWSGNMAAGVCVPGFTFSLLCPEPQVWAISVSPQASRGKISSTAATSAGRCFAICSASPVPACTAALLVTFELLFQPLGKVKIVTVSNHRYVPLGKAGSG